MNRNIYCLLCLFSSTVSFLDAATPPCGRLAPQAEGEMKSLDTFIPAPPDFVKTQVLSALPASGYRLVTDNSHHIEAKRGSLTMLKVVYRHYEDAGSKNPAVVRGTLIADVRPTQKDGVSGTFLHVESTRKHLAKPFLESVVCLSTILSPRTANIEIPPDSIGVIVPDGTEFMVALTEPLFTVKLDNLGAGKAPAAGDSIEFQVVDDVLIGGRIVIKKGAIAMGQVAFSEKAKMFGRHGKFEFAFKDVGSIDGKRIKVVGGAGMGIGGRSNDTIANAAILYGVGLLYKGNEAFIPAGTGYSLATEGEHSVQVEK